MWDHNVKPKDAVHVATALPAPEVSMFNTFDGPLIGKSGLIGSPPLTIEEPTITEPELNLERPENEIPA